MKKSSKFTAMKTIPSYSLRHDMKHHVNALRYLAERSDFDMNVLIGNLMQNAIEAAENSDAIILRVSVRYDDGAMIILVSNSRRGESVRCDRREKVRRQYVFEETEDLFWPPDRKKYSQILLRYDIIIANYPSRTKCGTGTNLWRNIMADLNNLNNTADHTSEFDPQDIEQNKVMGILAYLGILVLVPILAAKDSKFARYHANQGLVLFIAEIAVWIISSILAFIPYIGWILSLLCWLVNIGLFILAIIGIINAVNGRAKDLPIIGNIRILK